jgi:hypothetical protein
MIRFVVLFVAFLLLVSMAFALLVSALVLLAMACVVGIPLYLMSKRLMHRHGISRPSISPMERLRNLYVEGKIDLMEFERRVAHLISVER